jgi:hypothetical protein
MSKPYLLFLALLILFSAGLKAQAPCAFDKIHKDLLQKDPEYARRI